MAQDSLVADRRGAGERFLQSMAKHIPIDIAFWIKDGNDGRWTLYVVSDKVRHKNLETGIAAVFAASDEDELGEIDIHDVRFAMPRDPEVRAAMKIREEKAPKYSQIFRNQRIGGIFAEEFYIYPPIEPPAE